MKPYGPYSGKNGRGSEEVEQKGDASMEGSRPEEGQIEPLLHDLKEDGKWQGAHRDEVRMTSIVVSSGRSWREGDRFAVMVPMALVTL